MKSPAEMSRAHILVECALMVAISVALSLIPGISMPFGGTVSWFATLPIIIVSLRHNAKWGVLTALVYSLTQLFFGMSSVVAVPAETVGAMILCALLDYVVAFTAIGLTGAVARKIGAGTAALMAGIAITGLVRLLCSFLSGILIWGAYAPEDTSVWVYSLSYNASWCVPDVIVVLVGAALLSRVRQLDLMPRRATETGDNAARHG
ncbi:MAG: energy-coupled thiamine transporter ThiT [Oscillospiraceae bacterium]|jgi:thiamine transporter|nr:energy-coupled thiamine transporter ThiT [Oscillospiraceae bacterium]